MLHLVSAERVYQRAAPDVTDPDRPVAAARDEATTAECQRQHGVPVSL